MNDELTVRFSGESPYNAIVNYHGLDIEEESDFLDFLASRRIPGDSALEMLEVAYADWKTQTGRC